MHFSVVMLLIIVAWKKEISACSDRHSSCKYWAGIGECTRNRGYMMLTCKKSCNACYSRTTACTDYNNYCSDWYKKGECSRNPKYMRENCRKSCGYCTTVGSWSGWNSWRSCSKTCGGGSRTRTRSCSGGTCSGRSSETKTCNTNSCYAAHGTWSSWSKCSKSCGGGTMLRKRACPRHKKCKGSSTESMKCNSEQCYHQFSDWGTWTKCTEECGGGKKFRSRTCPVGKNCKGEKIESAVCNNMKCPPAPPVNVFTNWGVWSICSRSCDGGTRMRLRTCKSGHTCKGETTEVTTCNVKKCVKKRRKIKPYMVDDRNCYGMCGPRDSGDCENFCGIGGFCCHKGRSDCPKEYRDAVTSGYYSCVKISEQITDGSCGKQHLGFGTGRVVHGVHTLPGEFPWQVGLIRSFSRNKKHLKLVHPICGGALINPRTVLTAAHCLGASREAEDYHIRVGDNNINKWEDQEEVVEVQQIVVHKMYKPPSYDYDIALIILKREVHFQGNIGPVCLPDTDEPLDKCYVTGWGRTTMKGSDKTFASVLQKAMLPIVPNDRCNKTTVAAWKKIHAKLHNRKRRLVNPEASPEVTERMLCAGLVSGGKDACEGDSGGPFVCKRGNSFVIKGIVSWGVSKDCALPGTYGVYTRVYKFLEWIKKNAL